MTEDLISRQAALDCCTNGWNKDFKEIMTDIRALPSVTPARKKGRWSIGTMTNVINGEVRAVRRCSECCAGYFVYDTDNAVDETPHYCPDCGAKMEEVDE